ncbi:MAG TPA: hypothetical protein P5341_02230 [Hyphomonas sp.]|nr:hypothetical protein [Geminicoccaceae bacterium]HRX72899.1 hypothetical protein [Hyphomonas sp.]
MSTIPFGQPATQSSNTDSSYATLLSGIALLIFTFLFLYLFQPTEISDNALGYIATVQSNSITGITSFYPPHLLHAPIIGLFYQVLSNVTGCDAFCAGMLHSIFWAGIGVFSIFVMSRQLLHSTAGAMATAVMVLVAHGFWVYATQAEVYVPAMGCIMAATALLFTNRAPSVGVVRIVGVAAFWALATMYHLASVVLFLPFCVYFFATRGGKGWRELTVVCALAGSTVLASIIGAYAWTATAPLSIVNFFHWMLEITNRPLTDWGSVDNLFSLGDLVRAVWSQIKAITLLPDFLTLRLAPPLDQLPLAIIGSLLIGVVLLWNGVQVLRLGRAGWPRGYLLLMFAVFFVFFSWWDTSVHKFYIPASVPLIILTALAVRDLLDHVESSRARRLTGGAIAALIAVIFAFNLISIIELRQSRGPFYAEAEVLNRLDPEGCTIYTVGQHITPLKVYFAQPNAKFVIGFEREFYLLSTDQLAAEQPRLYSDETCAMVPLGWLTEQRFRGAVTPFYPAGRWDDYVAYMLDAQPSPDGPGITHHPFEVIETDALTYLVIDRQSRVVAADIDASTETIRAVESRVLEANWPARLTAEWGDTFLSVPRASLEINRDRKLIFGYSWGDEARLLREKADLKGLGLKN